MSSTPPKPKPLAPVTVHITYPSANAHVPSLFTATAQISPGGTNPQGWLTNSSGGTFHSGIPMYNPTTQLWQFPFAVTDPNFLNQEVTLTVQASDGSGGSASDSVPITVDS
jgi:hypothetical protein